MKGNPFKIGGPSVGRQESAAEIGRRFLNTLDALSNINPRFGSWGLVDLEGEPREDGFFRLKDVRSNLKEIVERGVRRDDFGTPEPERGYTISAYNHVESPKTDSFSVDVRVSAGSDIPYSSGAQFETGWYVFPDPEIVTYPVFKAVLMTLARDWELTYALAYSQELSDGWDDPPLKFDMAWMTYLSAPLAAQVVPPHDVVVEWTPDRGLLMIAAEQTFDTANPEHVAAAYRIRDALAPLNDLEEHERQKLRRMQHWREQKESGFPDERFKDS